MMKLYSNSTDPFSHRCRIVLFEKGMDFKEKTRTIRKERKVGRPKKKKKAGRPKQGLD